MIVDPEGPPDSAGWSEGDVDGADLSIHYHRTGNGTRQPLVLAHGFTDNGLCWSRTARALAARFDVVMVDARNHGRSGTVAGSTTDSADDLAAVIAGLGLERPYVMGHSLGGRTAAKLAARRPDLVARLVLEDPPWTRQTDESETAADERREGLRAYLRSLASMTDAELAELGRRQHPEWPDDAFPPWLLSKRQVRQEAADDLVAEPWADVVGAIACPTLLVYGDPGRGGLVTPEVADEVKVLNELVTTRRIDDAGHNIRRENFDGFIHAVETFLGST